jgi:hypothetical protein
MLDCIVHADDRTLCMQTLFLNFQRHLTVTFSSLWSWRQYRSQKHPQYIVLPLRNINQYNICRYKYISCINIHVYTYLGGLGLKSRYGDRLSWLWVFFLILLGECRYYYYGSTAPFLALAAFSVPWSYIQSVGLLGRGISPSQGLTYTQNNTNTE